MFTGGVGENAWRVRERVCANLAYMGVTLDAGRNKAARPRDHGGVIDVSEPHARTRVLVVHTEEERMIAREVMRCIAGPTAALAGVHAHAIPIGVSARHVHLCRRDCDMLFGANYKLAKRRDISQPGQYVTRETVDLVGPRGELHGVAIINPLRAETQVELARTDAIHLGIDPPLRLSGDLQGTPGLLLRGPRGDVSIDHGAIVAHRHLHASPEAARSFSASPTAT